jgi:hypothetical protein
MLGDHEEVMKYYEWHDEVRELIESFGLSQVFDSSMIANILEGQGRPTLYLPKMTLADYPKYSLFPANACPSFRKIIREAVANDKPLNETGVPEILQTFLDHVIEFTTHDGALSQGFPTSSILLNLVISDKGLLEDLRHCDPQIKSVSVYVDDIVLTHNRRPDAFVMSKIEQVIERSGIFRANRKKTRWFDLRFRSVDLLGVKLNRRPAVGDEPERINLMNGNCGIIRGRARAERLAHRWMQTFITLSKEKQKKYRGVLHRLTISDGDEKEIAQANGYHGHIVSVYGWPVTFMPSSLRKVVQAFRDKYHTPPLQRKRWNG